MTSDPRPPRRSSGSEVPVPPATGDGASRRPGGVSLLGVAAIFLRHRWVIVACAIVVPVVVVMAARLAPRTWTASTSFMPQAAADGGRSRLTSLAGRFGIDISAGESSQSPQFYADLVHSREILGAVAVDTFEVADTLGDDARGRLEGSLPDVLELAEQARPAARRAAAIGWLRNKAVSVETLPETGVIRLTATTPWPDLSAAVAERVVEQVNDFNLRTRQTQAAAERRFIEERLEEARGELRAAENELERFLRNNRQFRNSPELMFEHDRLQRQVSMRQEVYSSLVQSHEEARISEVRNTPVLTVMEEAEEPLGPDSRRLPLKAVLGLLLGAMLGGFLALAREIVRRQRQEEDDGYREFSVVWEETKNDVRGVLGKVRRS